MLKSRPIDLWLGKLTKKNEKWGGEKIIYPSKLLGQCCTIEIAVQLLAVGGNEVNPAHPLWLTTHLN